ncbi:MAG: hypothetical protein K8S62_12165 [Candidatus Sabulitectum sp.]|nr:hypothetical protein [Candidatus Sabulitectum sp.]
MIIASSLPANPDRVYILGAGRFGSSAALKISSQWPDCEVHLVDRIPEVSSEIPGEHHSGTDAIQFLQDNFVKERPDDLVIPCVPVHVAFNWVLSHFGFCIPVPVCLMEFLPGSVAGNDGCIYCSRSDFVCPDSCPEPEGYCPVTKMKRNEPLFETMEKINLNSYRTIIVRSGQLLPGVGALTAGQLSALLTEVRREKGRFLIGTASKCHGVIHGFVH